MKRIITLLLVYLLIYSSIYNNAYALGQSTYYTSVASTVFDRSTGQVTRNYNINTSLSSLQTGPDNRVVSKTTQARNFANRIKNAALRNNVLSLAITAAVAAVGYGIHEIKQDLYGNDIQEFGNVSSGTIWTASIVGNIGTGSTPFEAAEAAGAAYTSATDDYEAINFRDLSIDPNGSYATVKYDRNRISFGTGDNSGLTVGVNASTQESFEPMPDPLLETVIKDNLSQNHLNEIFEQPTPFINSTIQEVKEIQLNIIKEAYLEQVPFATISNDVQSVTFVPGTAPQIIETKINQTDANTDPVEVPDTYGNPWEELLPNGQPNPNYDPRTDLNSEFYDHTKDPRINDSLDVRDSELQKQQTQLLKDLKTLQQQQVTQQQQTKQQISNNSKESTQQAVKNALDSIDRTLKQTKTQQAEPQKLECGGQTGISCEATQNQILTEIKKITSPETEPDPEVITAEQNFSTLYARYEAIPIIQAVKSLNFGFSGQSCTIPSFNFEILGQSVNGDLSMVCTVITDIQTEIGYIMLFLFGILSLFLLLKA